MDYIFEKFESSRQNFLDSTHFFQILIRVDISGVDISRVDICGVDISGVDIHMLKLIFNR